MALLTWSGLAFAQNAPPADADVEVTAEPAPPAPAPSAAPSPIPAPAAAPPAAPPAATATVAAPAAPAPTAPPPPTTPSAAAPAATPAEPFVELHGYAQVEFQSHQDSQDQLQQNGTTPLNQNRFLVRRGRLIARRAWEYTSLEFELDGNTTNGPSFSLYRAEASAFYRLSEDRNQAPLVQLTMGLFRLPFGMELPESPSTRWYMERTQVSRALFPTEIDLGARLSGAYGPLRYAAALTNGEPAGEKSGFALQDPNKAKDFTINAGATGKPLDAVTITGGVSAIKGEGFHPGTPATKSIATWVDANENGVVDTGELVGSPGRAAVASQNFDRWALGGDLEVEVKTPIGATRVLGEVVAAKNLDRGFFPADPVSAGSDLREFGYFVGFTQELTPYAVVGFRMDFYDPNADATDKRAGKTLPATNSVTTYSPLVGVTLPQRARLVFQYDIIKDHLGRNLEGVPADLKNNAWTLRMQVSL
ncbi:MAG TPA: hypothetical protein VMI54_23505 [Polyangiaceae bacterium]|nr:hypothetical protein [Polyangiaceae bacterium]